MIIFFCIVVGFFAMKESKFLGAAVNLELCSLFPVFFFRRPHERTINMYIFLYSLLGLS